jgi:UDP-glucuronate decarboxylase
LRSCYDEGKRAAETLCFDFKRQHGVDVRVIRIFNTYGPNMSIDDGRVISNFICQALNGEKITIYGHGSQTRSFCYVSDLVEAIIKVILLPGCPSGPINLGNPTPSSISEIAQIILEKTNSRSEIAFLELPSDDPKHRLPDISFAKSLLNWQPTIDVSTGLNRTINYFKTVL